MGGVFCSKKQHVEKKRRFLCNIDKIKAIGRFLKKQGMLLKENNIENQKKKKYLYLKEFLLICIEFFVF